MSTFLKILASHIYIACATIDLNLSELEYLADHLNPEECRRLTAALHFNSYEKPNALDSAERKVSEDIPCIKLLLHWNSAKDEGRGETHEVLEHRLRQLGRIDLADWLGKTVFHQLGRDLDRYMKNAIDEDVTTATGSETKTLPAPTLQAPINVEDMEWIPFDTICWVIILVLLLVSAGILVRTLFVLGKSQIKKRAKKRYESSSNYCELESDTESETDKFDVRVHDDASFLLLEGRRPK